MCFKKKIIILTLTEHTLRVENFFEILKCSRQIENT